MVKNKIKNLKFKIFKIQQYFKNKKKFKNNFCKKK